MGENTSFVHPVHPHASPGHLPVYILFFLDNENTEQLFLAQLLELTTHSDERETIFTKKFLNFILQKETLPFASASL